jgi:penicillin-binding protein 1A
VTSEYVALTMVSMMRGVIDAGTATGAKVLGVPQAGKTGTVNDHTDVWFIGYTPTYVTGVWMGYPGRKKPLGNDMTGGHGALPFYVAFMKDFLKDKPKEDFEKAPAIPEDMKELNKQRKNEMSEDKLAAAMARASAKRDAGEETNSNTSATVPKLEQVTLPPAPKTDDNSSTSTAKPSTDTTPKKTEPPPPRTETPTTPSTSRPREVEPKKKGKKGSDEP